MQHGAFFGRVYFLAAKHGVDPSAHVALLGELPEQLQGGFSDSVLGIIHKQSCTFGDELFAAYRVASE